MLGYVVEVLQGQFAFVELAVTERIVDQPIDHTLDPGGRRFRERTAGRFHHVGQHDEPRLLGLRFGARIPIIVDIDGRQRGSLAALRLLACFQALL